MFSFIVSSAAVLSVVVQRENIVPTKHNMLIHIRLTALNGKDVAGPNMCSNSRTREFARAKPVYCIRKYYLQ